MQFRILCIVITGLALVGCSHIYGEKGWIKNNSGKQYLNAQAAQPLEVPADLDKSAMQEYYPIPSVKTTQNLQPVSIEPPGSNLAQALKQNKSQARSIFGKIRDWF